MRTCLCLWGFFSDTKFARKAGNEENCEKSVSGNRRELFFLHESKYDLYNIGISTSIKIIERDVIHTEVHRNQRILWQKKHAQDFLLIISNPL